MSDNYINPFTNIISRISSAIREDKQEKEKKFDPRDQSFLGIKELSLGAKTQSLHMDGSGFWIGAEKYEDAPFKVSIDGVFLGSGAGDFKADGSVLLTADLTFTKTIDHTIKIANATSGAGKSLTINAGNAGTGNFNGGNIILKPGVKSGTGVGGYVKVSNTGGTLSAILNTDLIATADRTFQFPNKSGTFAMLSDVPLAGANVNLSNLSSPTAINQNLIFADGGLKKIEGSTNFEITARGSFWIRGTAGAFGLTPGDVNIIGGNPHSSSTNGGNVILKGGSGGSAVNGVGGNVIIYGGLGTNSGNVGDVTLSANGDGAPVGMTKGYVTIGSRGGTFKFDVSPNPTGSSIIKVPYQTEGNGYFATIEERNYAGDIMTRPQGKFVIHNVDRALKIYIDGSWKTIFTW